MATLAYVRTRPDASLATRDRLRLVFNSTLLAGPDYRKELPRIWDELASTGLVLALSPRPDMPVAPTAVDVRTTRPTTTGAVAAAVARLADRFGADAVELVRVEAISSSGSATTTVAESSRQSSEQGTRDALDAASPFTAITRSAKLLTWAVIIGGACYLLVQAGALRAVASGKPRR